MTQYRLGGGPCDGRLSDDFLFRPPTGAKINCGGYDYIFGADNIFHAGSPTGTGAGPGVVAQVNTLQIDRAWHRFMHALGVDGPRAIRKSAADRKRLRRAVR